MSIIVGLDVGGSTTKIVGMQNGKIVAKEMVKATDPVTSAFGAIGKLINDLGIKVTDIERVNITGVGASFPAMPLLDIKTILIPEFQATGLGGLYISGLDHAVVVSMGTGTAYLEADCNNVKHIIGSGVGGGTIVGLCNSMVGIHDAQKLSELASLGDISKVDLSIGDISHDEIPGLPMNITASNFGKAADDLEKEDKLIGIFNLVYQSIGTISVMAANNVGIDNIVFTGQLTALKQCQETFEQFSKLYGKNFIVPDDAMFATAIGACVAGDEGEKE